MEIKRQFASQYRSKAGLRSPPHITLFAPFQWQESHESSLIGGLTDFVQQQINFDLVLNGYGAFAPRVVYVQVEDSPILNQVHHQLLDHLASSIGVQSDQREFRPHLTVAFRDLSPTQFQKAWREFKDRPIRFEFEAKSLALLKHNGRSWDVLEEITFQV